MEIVMLICGAIVGSVIASILACMPGLHVYNILGPLIFLIAQYEISLHPYFIIAVTAGMIAGFCFISPIPSVILAAPDESAFFTVLPGQKYLMAGRGYEAVLFMVTGSAFATAGLLIFFFFFAKYLLPLKQVLQPHYHWILWCVIAFMLMSEWPTEGRPGQGRWDKFVSANRRLLAGLLTFVLSGLIGFVVMYGKTSRPELAFQGLMPVFTGLFTLPWLLVNIIFYVEMPPQKIFETKSAGYLHLPAMSIKSILYGIFAGLFGGGFSAFFPAITGGVGGLLAGHATALRDDVAFLVSQGASRTVYYIGGFFLLFVPDLYMARGGASHLLKTLYIPQGATDLYVVMTATAIASVISLVMFEMLVRGIVRIVVIYGLRFISIVALVIILFFVLFFSGWDGIIFCIVSSAVGLIPVFWGARRMNCLGVILLPVACNMSGFGEQVAVWLGLI
jgi:putative membrane protein